MADQEEPADKAPWTIKAVPIETRKLAGACAVKAGETMAEWLARAVRNQASLEAGERVIPPGKPASGAPAVYPATHAVPPVNLRELAEAVQAATGIAQAAGVAVPAALARDALAAVRSQLRAARGLPPVQPRQTKRHDGQTIDAGHG